ncbi:MAG: T9SS type A sorting domain-containing protein [Candidatus Hatepunaea meridiana]|nr:T9SS type A sorting domain-containing protein [Candidatus Hatepunaea meridiana]
MKQRTVDLTLTSKIFKYEKGFSMIHARYIITIFLAVISMNYQAYAKENKNLHQIGRLFSSWTDSYDVIVRDDFAYIAAGVSGLQIVDISDQHQMKLKGSFNQNPGYVQNILLKDDIAFLLSDRDLIAVDISNPANPYQLSRIDINVTIGEIVYGNALIGDLAISGDYLYVGTAENGVKIIDISDNSDLKEVGVFEEGPFADLITSILVDDIYLYVAKYRNDPFNGIGRISVYAIANPTNPVLIGQQSSQLEMDYIQRLVIEGDYLYVITDYHLDILDISSPGNIITVGEMSLQNATDLIIDGDFAYITVWDGIRIVDISNPYSPEYFSVIETTSLPKCIDMDERLFIGGVFSSAKGIGGLEMFDISIPDEAASLDYINKPNNVFDLAIIDNLAIVLSDCLKIVDVSNPTNPTLLNSIYIQNGDSKQFEANDEIAFIAANETINYRHKFNCYLFDLSNPLYPRLISSLVDYGWEYATSVCISDNFAYVSGISSRETDGKLFIFDLTDLESPRYAGVFTTDDYGVDDVDVKNGYAFLATNDAFRIIDVRNPENIVEVGNIVYQIGERLWSVSVNSDRAYVSASIEGRNRLDLIDISDYTDPFKVSSISLSSYLLTGDITTKGDTVYISDFLDGVIIFDWSDPMNPIEIGYYDTPGLTASIKVQDNLLYLADATHLGIYWFGDLPDRFTVPEKFEFYAPYPNPFNSIIRFTYDLPLNSHVSLKLYDITGRRVLTVEEGNRQAGIHSSVLNASKLASGVYFVRLETSDRLFTTKVILIR